MNPLITGQPALSLSHSARSAFFREEIISALTNAKPPTDDKALLCLLTTRN